jgi:3-hydroxyisobutyrate dehydrogenase-like beta-hydroxyacid dehydrogenase
MDLPEQGWFDVGLLHKDLRLALEAARPLRAELPSARIADALFAAAERLGYTDRDIAAVHEVLALHSDELVELRSVGTLV